MFHTSKTAKMIKVILLRSPCQNVNVLLSNLTVTRVTWRHRSRDQFIPRWPFPIGGPLSPSLSPAVFEILGSKRKPLEIETLTFQGHVTSSVTWLFHSRVSISYRCSIVTKCVSPAVFEILGSRPWSSRVTHVTSSVTWPLDSGWIISYWWSFGPNVSITNGFRDIAPQTSYAHRHNGESSLRMRDITWHWHVPPM